MPVRKWSDDSETEEEVSDIEVKAGRRKDKDSEEFDEY